MMTEQKKDDLIVISIQGPDAQLYWRRLIQSIQLRYEIDIGHFPTKFWTGGKMEDNSLCEVNLLPDKYITNPMTGKVIKGLRNGVLHAIDGSYEWLKHNGYETEAQIVVDADRDRSRREGLLNGK